MSGVPQGSLLGPFVFVLCATPMSNSIHHYSVRHERCCWDSASSISSYHWDGPTDLKYRGQHHRSQNMDDSQYYSSVITKRNWCSLHPKTQLYNHPPFRSLCRAITLTFPICWQPRCRSRQNLPTKLSNSMSQVFVEGRTWSSAESEPFVITLVLTRPKPYLCFCPLKNWPL